MALHTLLLVPLMWGPGLHRAQLPNSQGASASHTRPNEVESMLVVFINEPQTVGAADAPEPPTSVSDSPVRKITAPDFSRFVRIDTRLDNPALEADGDENGHALMYGRYMAQVSARIQRAWIRPRSPVEGGSFTCRVRIAQSMSGAVQEVTLQQCNRDLRWQSSLVQAIQSASPLPAPPDPSVFSNLLSMELDSDEFHTGSRDDGYEPAPKVSPVGVPAETLMSRIAADRQRDLSASVPKSVELTIVGTRSSWEPPQRKDD